MEPGHPCGWISRPEYLLGVRRGSIRIRGPCKTSSERPVSKPLPEVGPSPSIVPTGRCAGIVLDAFNKVFRGSYWTKFRLRAAWNNS